MTRSVVMFVSHIYSLFSRLVHSDKLEFHKLIWGLNFDFIDYLLSE